ncbi:hypothetical protein QUF88_19290 [Bacillus sp. DX1.1]|uniref:hypothetical protein n=1 Tax=unclassified Bacillus (in: firmicutes) TaxID=185979 RepID=UPI0025711019|nr:MULTISPECIES: hypothetical protein [unclassified Bacillus (in: firmicutes)]MDM5155857.1 hypothetical protein [Bacillus sp. DX1.1]WJE80153.1 hypothetical protein QRE67_16820 [Bacillus sp. DX3.1]
MLNIFCGFGMGFILCLVVATQLIKAREVKEMTDNDKLVIKEMRQLKETREDKE